MPIAQDMRRYQAMTQDDARKLLCRAARLLNRIRKITLEADRKAIAAREAATLAAAPLKADYDALYHELTEYLKCHKDRFQSPRKVTIKGVGSFGWEKDPARIGAISEEDADLIKAFSDANGLTLYTETVTPDKKAILAAILAGHDVPGVSNYFPAGDNPKISFAKSIDEENIPGD